MDYLEKYAQERLEKLKGMRRQCVANLKGLPEGKVYVKKKRKTNQFYKITPDGDRNGKYIKAGERDVAESLVKREYNEKCLNEIEKEIRALEKMLKTCNSENLENVISKLAPVKQTMVMPLVLPREDFIKHWEEEKGQKVKVTQSHGGSGSQARSVVEGSNGDVVTLALEHDISLIEQTGLINKGWQKRFSNDSAPYTSTIVFLVRKGNKKSIKDWKDLIKKGVEVITPDPKSSGGACWNFLAAYGYAIDTYHDQKKEEQFLTKLYQNVSVMDSGARGSTTTFVENKKGDVLIAWENEAIQTVKNYPDKYEIITPSISILAQPSVSLVDDNVKVNGTKKIATEYLKYLYSDKAQKLAAEEGYRPSNERILKQYQGKFNLNMKLYKISDFRGWDQAYKKYFEDGALFDKIYINQ